MLQRRSPFVLQAENGKDRSLVSQIRDERLKGAVNAEVRELAGLVPIVKKALTPVANHRGGSRWPKITM
jgi:hypothetical protein